MKVVIYTDGSCLKNPGPGGYACVISDSEFITKLSGGEDNTTNNRMEMKAVICGLYEMYKRIVKFKKDLGVDEIEINSDSSYVVNAFNQNWVEKWKENGWITGKDKSVKNVDLWLEIMNLMNKLMKDGKVRKIRFKKVKGHDGVPLNEECDSLARKEALMIKNAKRGMV